MNIALTLPDKSRLRRRYKQKAHDVRHVFQQVTGIEAWRHLGRKQEHAACIFTQKYSRLRVQPVLETTAAGDDDELSKRVGHEIVAAMAAVLEKFVDLIIFLLKSHTGYT